MLAVRRLVDQLATHDARMPAHLSIWESINRLLGFYGPVWALAALYVAAGTVVRAAVGLERWQGSIGLVSMLRSAFLVVLRPGPNLLIALLTGVVILCLAQVQIHRRSGRLIWPFSVLAPGAARPLGRLARQLTKGLAVLLFLSFLSLGLTQWKVSIPYLVPFWADEMLMRADRALHLGNHPWQLIGAGRGSPVVSAWVDFLYHPMWLWLTWFAVPAAVALRAPALLLRRYLLTFTLLLVVFGTAAAILFSSAGPIYYERVVGSPEPYGPLIDYLQRIHDGAALTAWIGREYLWEGYLTSTYYIASGISAMPSMHVAAAALTAIVGFSWNRWAGTLGLVYTAVVLYASVYLSWHYAIDGYVSIVFVPLFWWLSSIALQKYDDRRRPR